MNEVLVEELGLNATRAVIGGLNSIIKTSELVMQDGQITFADTGDILKLATSEEMAQMIASFPQMLKEFSDLTPQESGQIVSWIHQLAINAKSAVHKAQANSN